MNGQIDAERILDAYLAPEADRLPDRVLDAALADIARTPQRRALRVPWRFPNMPALSRATGIAAVALVAVVGAGALFYLTSNRPGGAASESTSAPTTSAPTTAPTPGASEVAPGITGWKTYSSAVHGFTVGYPADWSVTARATRKWQPGDRIHRDGWPYADTFISPERDAAVGLLVWEMPAGEDAEGEGETGVEIGGGPEGLGAEVLQRRRCVVVRGIHATGFADVPQRRRRLLQGCAPRAHGRRAVRVLRRLGHRDAYYPPGSGQGRRRPPRGQLPVCRPLRRVGGAPQVHPHDHGRVVAGAGTSHVTAVKRRCRGDSQAEIRYREWYRSRDSNSNALAGRGV